MLQPESLGGISKVWIFLNGISFAPFFDGLESNSSELDELSELVESRRFLVGIL
jgi:hypothetical protein